MALLEVGISETAIRARDAVSVEKTPVDQQAALTALAALLHHLNPDGDLYMRLKHAAEDAWAQGTAGPVSPDTYAARVRQLVRLSDYLALK